MAIKPRMNAAQVAAANKKGESGSIFDKYIERINEAGGVGGAMEQVGVLPQGTFDKGFAPAMKDQIGRWNQTGIESFQEDVGGIGDAVGTASEAIDSMPSLGWTGKIRKFLTGSEAELFSGGGNESNPIPDHLLIENEVARKELDIDEKLNAVDQTYSAVAALRGEQLSANGHAILDQLEEQTVSQLDVIDAEIRQVQSMMTEADALRNPFQLGSAQELQETGVAPEGGDTADMLARMIASGGITLEQAQAQGVSENAFQDLANRGEELLAAAEGGADVETDLDQLSAEAAAVAAEGNVTNQDPGEFQFKMRARMRDLVDTRRQVVEEEQKILGALQNEDFAQATQQFQMHMDPTPQGGYLAAFDNRIDPLLSQYNLSGAALEEIETTLEELDYRLPPGEIDFTDPEAGAVQQGLMDMAETHGIDPTALLNEFQAARVDAAEAKEEMETVWETDRFTPGSLQLGTAIFQRAADQYGGARNEEGLARANMLANSPSLHMIIDLGSGGRVGAQRGGTRTGLGGLPIDILRDLGFDPKTMKGNAQEEIDAVIRYIDTQHQGDPAAALSYLLNNKSWAGS